MGNALRPTFTSGSTFTERLFQKFTNFQSFNQDRNVGRQCKNISFKIFLILG